MVSTAVRANTRSFQADSLLLLINTPLPCLAWPGLPFLTSSTAEHRVVQWLWQVVNELTREERKLFLKFFTGSDRAPIGGLGNLRCLIQVRWQGLVS